MRAQTRSTALISSFRVIYKMQRECAWCLEMASKLAEVILQRGKWNFFRGHGRFPFDQIFRFEIPGILCDEWNSTFRFVGLTRPRSSGSKFSVKIRNQTEDSFTFVYLLWGCSTTLKLEQTTY